LKYTPGFFTNISHKFNFLLSNKKALNNWQASSVNEPGVNILWLEGERAHGEGKDQQDDGPTTFTNSLLIDGCGDRSKRPSRGVDDSGISGPGIPEFCYLNNR